MLMMHADPAKYADPPQANRGLCFYVPVVIQFHTHQLPAIVTFSAIIGHFGYGNYGCFLTQRLEHTHYACRWDWFSTNPIMLQFRHFGLPIGYGCGIPYRFCRVVKKAPIWDSHWKCAIRTDPY